MSKPTVDFKDLIAEMQKAEVPADERPTILGGEFSADRLEAFLAAWRIDWVTLPWRIWEHISAIKMVNTAAMPDSDELGESDLLQRGEVFGEGGHLSLRRDGNRWLWHYVGPKAQPPPAGFVKKGDDASFWETAAGQIGALRRYEERILLWGQKVKDEQKQPDGPYWWEDRVAAARLEYPKQLRGHAHVYLKFWRYTDGGRTVFAWYRGLEGGA